MQYDADSIFSMPLVLSQTEMLFSFTFLQKKTRNGFAVIDLAKFAHKYG
jgi:hypothetical protein